MKKKTNQTLKALIIFSTISLSACESTPWAEIIGDKSKVGDYKNYDVVITGVNGQMFFDNKTRRKIDPGFNYIQLTSVKSDRRGNFHSQPFAIEAKPCMKYFVSAQYDTSTSEAKNWEVNVFKEEVIEHCMELLEKKE